MRLVVSDTSPIRVLHHVRRLHLLGDLFDEVVIPPAIERECAKPPISISITEIPKGKVATPTDVVAVHTLEARLQRGEAEAIVLAQELQAELLIDERAGREEAQKLGVARTGVIGLLIRAKQRGLIPQVVPLILRVRNELGFYVSDDVIQEARRLASE